MVFILTNASALASYGSNGREYASNLEDDIELQLNEYSYTPPADITVINEQEIRAALQQPFEKDVEKIDEIEVQQNGWCGRKFIYSGLSDVCTLVAAVCQGVGAAKLAADTTSTTGQNLIYTALGFTAAQGFFKKLQDNETIQRNKHTKKVAKSTLAANNVLLKKMVEQSENFRQKLAQEAESSRKKYIALLQQKKSQIETLQQQHLKDLDDIQLASSQAEAIQVQRKQEIKEQAKILSILFGDAKQLLSEAKNSLGEQHEKLVYDIEVLIKRSETVLINFMSPVADIMTPPQGSESISLSPLNPYRKKTFHGVTATALSSRKRTLKHQETAVTNLMESKLVRSKSSSPPQTIDRSETKSPRVKSKAKTKQRKKMQQDIEAKQKEPTKVEKPERPEKMEKKKDE